MSDNTVQIARKGVLVACGDAAHRSVINMLLEDHFGRDVSVDDFDLAMLPGGAHFMREPGTLARDFILGQIMTYARLHDVVIVLTRECGAYGGQNIITDEQNQDAFILAQKLETLGLNVCILADVNDNIVLHETPAK